MPKRNDELNVPCPFCDAPVGRSCVGIGDANASHWSRYGAAKQPDLWKQVTEVIRGEKDAVYG